jgi:hypothetical protein
MTSMQERITAELTVRAEAAGLVFLAQPEWANTGHFYVQQEWDSLLTVAYEFQSDHCHLIYSGPAMLAWKHSRWQDHPGARWDEHRKAICGWVIRYNGDGEVQAQLDMFTDMIAPYVGTAAFYGEAAPVLPGDDRPQFDTWVRATFSPEVAASAERFAELADPALIGALGVLLYRVWREGMTQPCAQLSRPATTETG